MEVILKATETTRIRFKILLPFTLLAALLDVQAGFNYIFKGVSDVALK